MRKLLIFLSILCISTAAFAINKTQEDYKQELLDKGYLFGCAPANWSLIEPIRGGFNYAVVKNRTDIMELEVKAGLNPLSCSKYNGINAITKKSDDALAFLLKHGYDPDTYVTGFSYLTYAINRKNVNAVKILVDNGASVNTYKNEGYNPLNTAIKKKQPEIVKILLDAGAKPNEETIKLVKKTKCQQIKQLFNS